MEWYKLSIEDVYEKTKSSSNGLTKEEVKKRLERDGLNELPRKKKAGPIKIFFSEFKDSRSGKACQRYHR